MVTISVLIGLALLALVAWLVHRARRKAWLERLRAAPFPGEWQAIVDKRVPLARRLSEEQRGQLQGLIQVFLGDKNLEGAGGLELTDEIRVTIAAQACMLLLDRDIGVYPRLSSVVVYPSAYVSERLTRVGEQHVESEVVLLGESWGAGTVVLAWDSVRRGTIDPRDGHNVVLHEFAHQLDQEDGRSDGVPILDQRTSYLPWARVLGEEFDDLQEAIENDHSSLMDDYGGTNPAEFFAVATETFFERGRQMKKRHPELYQQLSDYYRLDPASWPK